MPTPITITVNFIDLTGNTVQGYMQAAVASSSGVYDLYVASTGIIAPKITSSVIGSTVSVQVWGNDVIVDTADGLFDTYYTVTLYNTSNVPVWTADYSFTGAGPINLVGYPTLSAIPAPTAVVPTNILTGNNIFSGNNTFTGTTTFIGTALGLVGGSNTNVQFNNGGVFGGSNSFTFSSGQLTISTNYPSDAVYLGPSISGMVSGFQNQIWPNPGVTPPQSYTLEAFASGTGTFNVNQNGIVNIYGQNGPNIGIHSAVWQDSSVGINVNSMFGTSSRGYSSGITTSFSTYGLGAFAFALNGTNLTGDTNGEFGMVAGVRAEPTTASGSHTDWTVGLLSSPNVSDGTTTVTNLVGVRAIPHNSSGSGGPSVTNAFGFLSEGFRNLIGAGTVTNNYGFYARTSTSATNNFAYYAEDSGTGTNNYSYFSAGGKNKLNGKLILNKPSATTSNLDFSNTAAPVNSYSFISVLDTGQFQIGASGNGVVEGDITINADGSISLLPDATAPTVTVLGSLIATNLVANAATPTGSAGQLSLGTTAGFGNGAAAQTVTTTLKGTGTGPTTAVTVIKYLEIDIAGTKYWVPLMQ